jgi:hypothetical protein
LVRGWHVDDLEWAMWLEELGAIAVSAGAAPSEHMVGLPGVSEAVNEHRPFGNARGLAVPMVGVVQENLGGVLALLGSLKG